MRWLTVEGRLHAFDLLVSATRSFGTGELTGGASRRLGDEEREEVSEISEVGVLEVMPRQKPHIWTLRIRVEDDIGACQRVGFGAGASMTPRLPH